VRKQATCQRGERRFLPAALRDDSLKLEGEMMKKKKLFIFLIGLILLTLLSCQAAANLPNPFATAIPSSTPTFTPSPTSSPTLTAAYTPTPPPTGTTKEKQTDGTTVFTDYDNQYELVFPAG